MDISVSGVKGYEFQYKATLFLTLKLLSKNHELKVYVEPANGEDFLIVITENDIETRIEVQVKREKSKLNENKLNEWLCHFESYSSEDCLLSRVISSNNYAVFITRSRCSDSTSFLIQKNDDIIVHENYTTDNTDHLRFYSSLKQSRYFKPTKLGISRNNFCNQLAKKIEKKTDFEKIFKKILILENLSDENLDSQIKILLGLKFQISHSRLNEVYLYLLDSIKAARDSKNDWIDNIKEILQKNRVSTPKLNKNYVPRGIESELIEKMDKERILLLTGLSLCGKTEVAKQIAYQYAKKGYSYNIVPDFLSAEAFFFSTNPDEDKILILEDPFGHIELINEVASYKLKLENLIGNLHDNHKLIVTSRKELVKDVYIDFNIIGSKKFEWQDLTIKNQGEAIAFWDTISKLNNCPVDLVSKIDSVIKLNSNLKTLQIGQIQYLSKFDETEIRTKSLSALETIARQNSNDIALELCRKNNDLALLLSILSFCGNTISRIPVKDLEYILGKDKVKYTVIKSVLERLKEEKEFTFKYLSRDKLSKGKKRLLADLEDRGFIIEKTKSFLFSHPNYYEAGRYVFKNFKKSNQKIFLQHLEKAISCNNEQISFFSSRQFVFLYANSADKEIKKRIIKIAFKSLLSIFPSVTDYCLVFLLSINEELTEDQKNNIIQFASHNNFSTLNLEWYNENTPYQTHNRRIMLERKMTLLTKKEVIQIEQQFINNEDVSVKDAWSLLYYYDKNKATVIKDIYEKFILYNVSFLRAKACYLFFRYSINADNLQDLILKAFKDDHPSVVFNCFRGSFQSWKNYSDTNKSLIRPMLESSLLREDVAIRASSLMTTFGIDYASEGIKLDDLNENQTSEIWELWSSLYKIYQKVVPPNLNIHTPRFIANLNNAMKHITAKDYVEVLNCWYDNIVLKIDKKGILDGFEFSIAKNLIESTKDDYTVREQLFEKLISFPDTSFLLSSVRCFVSYWEILSKIEQNKIIELLKGNRKDKRWIKAVILTSYTIPDELSEFIMEEKDYFKNSVDYIIRNFEAQLLEDCVSVYFGHPFQLSDVSTHHDGFELWQNITNFILKNNNAIGYKTSLSKFLFEGVNGFNDLEKELKLWRQICKNSTNKMVEAKELIYATASCCCNIESAKKLWSILIRRYQLDGQSSEIIKIIKENLIILQYAEREDLFEIIDNKILLSIMDETFPDNKFIIALLDLKDGPNIEDEGLISELIENASSVPFQFYNTILFAERISDQVHVGDDIRKKLKSVPDLIMDLGKPTMEDLNDKYNYILTDWIYYKNN